MTLVAPVKAFPFVEHMFVTFLNHPSACAASIGPLGLVMSMRDVPGTAERVGKAVMDVLVE